MVQVNTPQIAKEMCFNNTGVHMNICMNPGTYFCFAKNWKVALWHFSLLFAVKLGWECKQERTQKSLIILKKHSISPKGSGYSKLPDGSVWQWLNSSWVVILECHSNWTSHAETTHMKSYSTNAIPITAPIFLSLPSGLWAAKITGHGSIICSFLSSELLAP